MLASIFSLNVIQTALELGCIYALVALALFLSYSILNIADLSTDGCFTLGCAVACQVALTGHPFLALLAAMAAGVCSGFITAFLQTRLGVESIMAGIIVNTGLYTINLAVMGFSSTMSLVKTDTVFSIAKSALSFTGGGYKLVLAAAVIALAGAAWWASSEPASVSRSVPPAITLHGACFQHQPRLHHHGGPLHLGRIDRPFRRPAGSVPEELRHQRRHRHGDHRAGFPHHRRNAGGQADDGAPCAGRRVRQLPLPFYRGGGLRFNVPAAAMKLVSAIIVAVAISMPAIREKIAFEKRRSAARQARKERV